MDLETASVRAGSSPFVMALYNVVKPYADAFVAVATTEGVVVVGAAVVGAAVVLPFAIQMRTVLSLDKPVVVIQDSQDQDRLRR